MRETAARYFKNLGFSIDMFEPCEDSLSSALLHRADLFVAEVRKRYGVVPKPALVCLDRLQQHYRPVLECQVHVAPWCSITFTLPLDNVELFDMATANACALIDKL